MTDFCKRNFITFLCLFFIGALVLYFEINNVIIEYTYTDPSAFIPEPESFDLIDDFLAHQKKDPTDPFGITMLPAIQNKFTKDNSHRVMQKNWNVTLFPYYGGPVINPIIKKTIFDGDVITEEIKNPLGFYIY